MIDVQWWPPAPGAKLRRFAQRDWGDAAAQLVHVKAVFEHDIGGYREVFAACAEWLPGRRRWHFEVYDKMKAKLGMLWRDGEPCPDERLRKRLGPDEGRR